MPRLAGSTKQLCEIIDIIRDKHLRLVIVGSITLDCRNGKCDPMSEAYQGFHSDAQFDGNSSVPAHVEMMGLIGAGNNPKLSMTVAVAVAVEEAMNK